MPTKIKALKIWLAHLPGNNAFAFLFGREPATASILDVDGRKLFLNRAGAIKAAERIGWHVGANGFVTDTKRIKKNSRRRKRRVKAKRNPRAFKLVLLGGHPPGMKYKPLHYDGHNFSDTNSPKLFGTVKGALNKGRELVRRYPDILKKYQVTVWTAGPPKF